MARGDEHCSKHCQDVGASSSGDEHRSKHCQDVGAPHSFQRAMNSTLALFVRKFALVFL
jgi:hypothetical protein